MGIFGKKLTLERLENRLAELEAAHDDLGRTIRGLELEYIELYDKVRHQMSRMSKRYAADNREMAQDPPAEVPDDGVDPISAEILARRGGPRKIA